MKSKNVTDLQKPHSSEIAQKMSSSKHSQTACKGVSEAWLWRLHSDVAEA